MKNKKAGRGEFIRKRILPNWQLYLLLIIPVIYIMIFAYYPIISGVRIAFSDYSIVKGIWGSPWAGFTNFARFFRNYQFFPVIRNTISLSLYSMIAGFPFPIILALALNYTRKKWFKKTVQMVTYAPYFISTIVLVGMMLQLFAYNGIINAIIGNFGAGPYDFLGKPDTFPSMYVWSGVWQGVGFGSIIYLAVLSNSDEEIHEAATIDGASKTQRIRYIDIHLLMPTATILLIMNVGSILNIGFEKVFAMQNPLNLRTSEVLSTLIYKTSLKAIIPDFSYGTAVGFFQSTVGLLMIILLNQVSKKLSDTSLW